MFDDLMSDELQFVDLRSMDFSLCILTKSQTEVYATTAATN